jgi:hypothetical protein
MPNQASPSSRDADYDAFGPCYYTGFVMFFAFLAVRNSATVGGDGRKRRAPKKREHR